MKLLESIHGPEDLKAMPADQMPLLAEEIRAFLVDSVSKTGGHLGPNLGVVELTIALHRVFDSPHDSIVFDTGHQSYVHKMLTGRCQGFAELRLSMTSWRTRTPRRPCPGQTASPRRAACRAGETGIPLLSLGMELSPAGWRGKQSTTSRLTRISPWSSSSTTTSVPTR